jgi:hypothetical protein
MSQIKITVLGSGGAFATMEQGNSSFLVEHGERKILIDCGMTVPYVLRDEMGIPLQSITDVIITHTHSDHSGGLELILHACRWIGKCRPTVWASPRVHLELTEALSVLCWEQNEIRNSPSEEHYIRSRVHQGELASLAGLPLELKPVKHVGAMPATSVRLGPLFVSGDTEGPVGPSTVTDIRLVFHEAEISPFASGVHCPIADLETAYEHHPLKASTWIYHCPPQAVVEGTGFAGRLHKGQTFTLGVNEDEP